MIPVDPNAIAAEVRGDDSDGIRLFVALPVYGGYNMYFMPCLMDLVLNPPCDGMHIHHNPGDSLVARARNRLVAKFLAGQGTHLLFIDTDLIFSPAHIKRLLDHKLPLVCGCYPKKQPDLAWVLNALPGEERDPATGLQKVRHAGTGFMLIERAAFERIAFLHPEIQYDPDDGEEAGQYFDFFQTGVFVTDGRRRYLSEDWAFCHLAKEAGIDTYVDTNVVLKHCGDAIYPLQDLSASKEAPATGARTFLSSSEEPTAQPQTARKTARKRAKGKTKTRR